MNIDDSNKLADILNRAGNRWARLEVGFKLMLSSLGVPEKQKDKIITDVKDGNFDSLDKLLKVRK